MEAVLAVMVRLVGAVDEGAVVLVVVVVGADVVVVVVGPDVVVVVGEVVVVVGVVPVLATSL